LVFFPGGGRGSGGTPVAFNGREMPGLWGNQPIPGVQAGRGEPRGGGRLKKARGSSGRSCEWNWQGARDSKKKKGMRGARVSALQSKWGGKRNKGDTAHATPRKCKKEKKVGRGGG